MYISNSAFNILIIIIFILIIIAVRNEVKLRKMEDFVGLLGSHVGSVDKLIVELFNILEGMFKSVDSAVKKREGESNAENLQED